ncbi:MAG: nitronate monooxygenase, partial [Anaerolineae bacterium]|nr:nitronate monooxygenase [Anaerolineae bacterium]
QNPGVRKVIQENRKSWARLGLPIIVHLPADLPDDLTRTARALSSIQTPQGDPLLIAIELGLPLEAAPQEVEAWIAAIQAGSELPLLVKLPIGGDPALAERAVKAQADALVIGTPPLGTAYAPAHRQTISGHLFGSALHSLVLRDLQMVANVDVPLVAVGGIHSAADVHTLLQAGATAVQIDSLLFIDPQAAYQLAFDVNNTLLDPL